MKTPNPLLPQGSLPEYARGHARMKLTFFAILGAHVAILAGFLILGCKKESPVPPPPTGGADSTGAPQPPPFYDNTNTPPAPTDGTVGGGQPGGIGSPPPGGAGTGIGGGPGPGPGLGVGQGPGTLTPGGTAQTPGGGTPTVGGGVTPPPPGTGLGGPGTSPGGPDPGVAPAGAATDHKIAKGETIGGLAKKYKVKEKDIMALNPGLDPRKLKIDQVIKLPAPSAPAPGGTTGGGTTPAGAGLTAGAGEIVYEVKANDSLYRIAKAHGTTVKEIQKLNNLKTTAIKPKEKLRLPAKAGGGAAHTPTTGGGTTPPPPPPVSSPGLVPTAPPGGGVVPPPGLEPIPSGGRNP